MDFRVLGPLEVWRGDVRLELGAPKQRALLALLLLHRGEVVSTDRLVDELWGGRAPQAAAKSVQVYVSGLRKALGEGVLETRGRGYVLEALSLWRGPALADFTYEDFAQEEIDRLEELRLTALEERIDADLALGGHADLVAELTGLVGEHPLRERIRAQLMLRAGRRLASGADARPGKVLLTPYPARTSSAALIPRASRHSRASGPLRAESAEGPSLSRGGRGRARLPATGGRARERRRSRPAGSDWRGRVGP